ncbi:MAG: phosphatase PAP2 family protein [Halodesulfurarchaeum sp.]
MRDWGLTAALTDLPEWVTALLVILTAAGDPATILLFTTGLYWVGPRWSKLDRVATLRVLLVVVVALTAVTAAKAAFGLPRPPAELRAIAADGYGFPSGHATGATALGVSLAWLLDEPSRRTRWMGAIVFGAGIAATRVALGVHYLGDVLVGMVLGSMAAAVTITATRDRVWAGLGLAVGLSILGALLTGLAPGNPMTRSVALGLGGTVGMAGGWQALARDGAAFDEPSQTRLLGGGLALLLGAGGAWLGSGPLVAVASAVVAGAAMIGVPHGEAPA